MTDPRDPVLQAMIRRLDAMTPRELLTLVAGHLIRRVVFSTDTADAWLEDVLGVAAVDPDPDAYRFDLVRDATPDDVGTL